MIIFITFGLFIFSVMLFIIGLIFPSLALFWRKDKSRKSSSKIYGLCCLLFLILFMISLFIGNISDINENEYSDNTFRTIEWKQIYDSTFALSSKAMELQKSGIYDESIKTYSQIIAMTIDSTDVAFRTQLASAYGGRAIAYAFNKQYGLAESDLDSSLLLNDYDYSAHLNRYGTIKFIAKDYKGALDVFNRSVIHTKNKNDSLNLYDALTSRAKTEMMLNEQSRAFDDCNEAIGLYPEFGNAYLMRAILRTDGKGCEDYFKAKKAGENISALRQMKCE